jgi:hypothetical protein
MYHDFYDNHDYEHDLDDHDFDDHNFNDHHFDNHHLDSNNFDDDHDIISNNQYYPEYHDTHHIRHGGDYPIGNLI